MALNAPTNTPALQAISPAEIEQAMVRGTRRYFEHCRAGIPTFVDHHFRYPGAIKTNRAALGWDMLRAPVNLFWAPLFALLSLVKFAVGRSAKLGGLSRLLKRIPAGFTTQVQKNITDRVATDLLHHNDPNASLVFYIAEELKLLYERHEHQQVDRQRFHQLTEPVVEEAMAQYRITRTASADITNTVSCTILGAFAFQKFTPGGIGVALMLASVLSSSLAAQDFMLGETLGHLYYELFPPEPTLALTAGVTAAVLAVLAAFAALSGIISDPVQAKTGLHRRRLEHMLDHMEQDVIDQAQSSFRPKDQYVARILESFDLIKSGFL